MYSFFQNFFIADPEACKQIKWTQAVASCLENLIDVNNPYYSILVSSSLSCVADGLVFNPGDQQWTGVPMPSGFNGKACAKGALSAAVAQGVFAVGGWGFSKMRNMPMGSFLNGLARLGIDPDRFAWIFKKFRNIDDANDLAAFLKIDPAKAADLINLKAVRDMILDNGPLVTKIRNLGLDVAERGKLVDDMLDATDGVAFRNALDGNPELVRAWKVLINTIPQAIRTNPTYLSAVSKQLVNYGDDIVFQFDRVLPHVDPAKLDDLFAALDNPKSIDHVRSIAGDFENIPGINMSTYVANGLPKVAIPAPSTWPDPLLGLPDWTATTFSNVIGKTLSPNQKLYRVLGPDQSSMGGFWTYELPTSKSQLYGGTAVRPEWNAATHYVEYTVPPGGLKVWDGPTASQKILDGIDEVNLPGGATQIYIPDPYRQVGSGFENLPKIPINLQ